MNNFKELTIQEMRQINGGGLNGKQIDCLKDVGGDMGRYGATGAFIGGIGGAVIGANVGLVTGGLKCALKG